MRIAVKEGPAMPQRTASTSRKPSSKSLVLPAADSTQARDRLRQTIVRDLSPQDRLFLVLAYAERMSPREIAATLNLAPAQVEVMRERIVRELNDRLQAA